MYRRLSNLPWRRMVAIVLGAGVLAIPAQAEEAVLEQLQEPSWLPRLEQMPCGQRVGTLETNLPRPSYMTRPPQAIAREREIGAEATLQLAMLSFKGECLRRDEGPLRTLAARGDPRAVSALRILTDTSPQERATAQVRADDRPRLDRLPKPDIMAARTRAMSRRCTATSAGRVSQGERPPSQATAPLPILAYWALSNVGNEALCEGLSPDTQTRAYFYDWPHIVSFWQATVGRTQTGELAAADIDDLYRRIDVAATQIERERRDLQLAEVRQAQQEQAAIKDREQRASAAERDFNAYLSRSQDPQNIYLQAGKYERTGEAARAKQLYEFLIDGFSKTKWAVSANDRLLQMRSEEQARAPSKGSPSSSGQPGGTRRGGPVADPTAQMQDDMRRQREDSARQEQERAAEFQRVQESQRRAWEVQQQIERERQQQIERNSR